MDTGDSSLFLAFVEDCLSSEDQSSALWLMPSSSATAKNAFLEFLMEVSETQNARRQ